MTVSLLIFTRKGEIKPIYGVYHIQTVIDPLRLMDWVLPFLYAMLCTLSLQKPRAQQRHFIFCLHTQHRCSLRTVLGHAEQPQGQATRYPSPPQPELLTGAVGLPHQGFAQQHPPLSSPTAGDDFIHQMRQHRPG